MSPRRSPPLFLIADDDPADQRLAVEAVKQSNIAVELRFVSDGEELLEYLWRTGRYAPPVEAPAPRIVLLDLNMPRKTGLEALREIKADRTLRRTPVVVLTTSASAAAVQESYRLGANSYITKPAAFADFVVVMETLGQYWIDVVQVSAPTDAENHAS